MAAGEVRKAAKLEQQEGKKTQGNRGIAMLIFAISQNRCEKSITEMERGIGNE